MQNRLFIPVFSLCFAKVYDVIVGNPYQNKKLNVNTVDELLYLLFRTQLK